MTVIPFPIAPGRDPTEEKAFFRSRLYEEKAALLTARDTAATWRHRRLIARYETVLKLYKESELGERPNSDQRARPSR